jgi:hypothetical protein
MPAWDEILNEIRSTQNVFDSVRRSYIKKLSEKTGRNTIIYYSAFLQKGNLSAKGIDLGINDNDKNGFMTVINGMDRSKGLDLILHTPGGLVAATESLQKYLKSMFGNDIRAIIPQIAMSGGTMLSCACKSIVMGKQSNLGPIDPQFGTTPASGVIEEFTRALSDVKKDPSSILVWKEILQKYQPTFIGECEKAILWAKSMVTEWLKENMFLNDPKKDDKVGIIVDYLSDHNSTFSHGRHIHADELKSLGLKIEDMESDQELQDLILSVHHSTIISMTQTQCYKIIENNMSRSFIQSV